tara:strand:+ start:789 stop:1040 length:252 start_codon:yes stop_codon:yes gene_type:complete
MSIFKLPSFLRGKNPKPLIEVFAEPEEEQSHSSGVERSDSAEEVGKPILSEESDDANSQGEEVPIHDGRTQGRRRRRKKAQGS